jgi:hypothetical protein
MLAIAGAAGAANKASEWGTPVIVATALGGAGVLLAAVALYWQWSARREQEKQTVFRRRLATALAEGQTLLAEVNRGDPTRDFTDLKDRVATWNDTTTQELERHAPDLVAVFHSETVNFTLYATQYADRDRLGNHLRVRTSQLVEIIRHLG